MTRFIHLSDPQLLPSGELNYNIDPQVRLRMGLDSIVKDCGHCEPDFITVTGDLAHWGEVEAYQCLKQELERLPYPVFLLMGNHDRRKEFRTVFSDHPASGDGFIQYVLNRDDGVYVFLDTLDERKRSGILCSNRLAWLRQVLNSAGEQPVYLLMHHPPFTVGLPSMDGDNLVNTGEFWNVIKPYQQQIQHIFLGHLHRTVSGTWRRIGYSCPLSTVHQTPFEFTESKPGYVSPEPPAYHFVEIRDEQVVVHSRLFLHSEPRIDSRTSYRYQPDHSE